MCLFHALMDVNTVVLEADGAGVDGDVLYLGAASAFRENRVVGGDCLVCFLNLPTREQRLVRPAIARMSGEQQKPRGRAVEPVGRNEVVVAGGPPKTYGGCFRDVPAPGHRR